MLDERLRTRRRPGRERALVRSMEKGSPIANSGLVAGDVIVAVDGTPVATLDDLAGALNGLAETYDGGDQFELTIARGNEEETLKVTLAGNVYLGAELLDAPPGRGLSVDSVPRDGPAADAGLQPDDVIVTVDGQAVAKFDDLLQALATHVAGDDVEIEVTRGSKELTLTATLEKRGVGQLKARPGG